MSNMNQDKSMRKIKKIIGVFQDFDEKEKRFSKKVQKQFSRYQNIEQSTREHEKKAKILENALSSSLECNSNMRSLKDDQLSETVALKKMINETQISLQQIKFERLHMPANISLLIERTFSNILKQTTKLYISSDRMSNDTIEGITWDKLTQNFESFQIDSSKINKAKYRDELLGLTFSSNNYQEKWAQLFMDI